MKFKLFALFLFLGTIAIFQSSCTPCYAHPTTNCIDDIIEDIKQAPVQSPPAVITKWVYDGETYYYVTADCCDMLSSLYDADCNELCAPDGGFSGGGSGNCPDFVYDDHNGIVKTIYWKDPRQ